MKILLNRFSIQLFEVNLKNVDYLQLQFISLKIFPIKFETLREFVVSFHHESKQFLILFE